MTETSKEYLDRLMVDDIVKEREEALAKLERVEAFIEVLKQKSGLGYSNWVYSELMEALSDD